MSTLLSQSFGFAFGRILACVGVLAVAGCMGDPRGAANDGKPLDTPSIVDATAPVTAAPSTAVAGTQEVRIPVTASQLSALTAEAAATSPICPGISLPCPSTSPVVCGVPVTDATGTFLICHYPDPLPPSLHLGLQIRGICGGPADPATGMRRTCNADESCIHVGQNVCGNPSAFGLCVVAGVCDRGLEQVPVCGCDGVSYRNACDLVRAGADVKSLGLCGPTPPPPPPPAPGSVCGGLAGTSCGAGLFCKLPTGTCGAADQTGICTVLPQVCTQQWQPVCGCDGHTYGNECAAGAAGASVYALGPCPWVPPDAPPTTPPAPPPSCSRCSTPPLQLCGGCYPQNCGAGNYCRRDCLPGYPCNEGTVGYCAPQPPICGLNPLPYPVCGCGGSNYCQPNCWQPAPGMPTPGTPGAGGTMPDAGTGGGGVAYSLPAGSVRWTPGIAY